jgi:dTDP-glucose pyrophosphorylase
MSYSQKHIVNINRDAREALRALDSLPETASKTVFVINDTGQLVGSLTDGDIRRGLLNGLEISQPIETFMNINFKSLKVSAYNIELIKAYRKSDIQLIPLIDEDHQIIEVIDLKLTRTVIPVAALIMAGGRGERLRPLTDSQPKPMLKVGNKPIIEHNIDRLILYGIKDIYISVKYLKEQIMDHLGNGESKGINIYYVEEQESLGTLGALALIKDLPYEDILVMNSDILTNIDFEDFYKCYKDHHTSMALASIPYHVKVPYAVLETINHRVLAFKEKPSYTYYTNGGIYLMKFELRKLIESGSFFNATDMMDLLIAKDDQSLVHYPLVSYWLDIGKYEDFTKAQEDIKHISLL